MILHARRRPFSELLTDTVVLAMAVWTISCHGVVLTSGNLLNLRLSASVARAVLAILLVWRRKNFTSANPTDDFPSLAEEPGDLLPPRYIIAVWALVISVFALAYSGWILLAWVLAVVGLAGALLMLRSDESVWQVPTANLWTALILGLLAISCGLWTLVLYPPDRGDDPFFVNLGVAAADQPAKPLLAEDTMYGIPGAPLRAPYYRAHSIEMLAATVSHTLGVPAIYVSHWGLSALAGFFLPLAAARVFRLLVPGRWLFSLVALLLVLVIAAGASDGYANCAFVRLYQGKAIFVSVLVPLIFVYAIEFTAAPRMSTWLLLGAVQVAALGMTSTALWAAPATTVLGIAAAQRNWSIQGFQRAATGLCTSGYVLALAFFIRQTTLSTAIGTIQRLAKGEDLPATAGGMMATVFDIILGDQYFALFATGCVLAG